MNLKLWSINKTSSLWKLNFEDAGRQNDGTFLQTSEIVSRELQWIFCIFFPQNEHKSGCKLTLFSFSASLNVIFSLTQTSAQTGLFGVLKQTTTGHWMFSPEQRSSIFSSQSQRTDLTDHLKSSHSTVNLCLCCLSPQTKTLESLIIMNYTNKKGFFKGFIHGINHGCSVELHIVINGLYMWKDYLNLSKVH